MSNTEVDPQSPKAIGRRMTVPGALVAIIAYLAVLKGSGLLIQAIIGQQGSESAAYPDATSMLFNMVIPIGSSVLFAVALITWLGWWPRVNHDRIPIGRWAWLFPVTMALAAVAMINYPNLATQGAAMVLLLALGGLFVGLGEEFMFRGVVLESLRRSARTNEIQAALWTAVIFGAVHLANFPSEGSGAFVQAGFVIMSGLLFYLARRVSGGILLPVLLHGFWDFSLLSSQIGPDPQSYAPAGLNLVVTIGLTVVALFTWRKIWPKEEAEQAAAPA